MAVLFCFPKRSFVAMQNKRILSESELILNPDGSIFHLHLKPGQLSNTILLVGDPGRVMVIQEFLSDVEHLTKNREYVSTTGKYNGKRISVVSTGVGVGNVDIVMNELDALFNIDFKSRSIKEEIQKLNFIRIGTSGGLQPDIDVNSFVLTQIAVGMDNVLPFYAASEHTINKEFTVALQTIMGGPDGFLNPFAIDSSKDLLAKLYSEKTHLGITLTSPGFYGPQGRELRLKPRIENINDRLSAFRYKNVKITNYEMEAAVIFGLAKILGHEAATICLIVANRMNKNLNDNYHDSMKSLIKYVLDRLSE